MQLKNQSLFLLILTWTFERHPWGIGLDKNRINVSLSPMGTPIKRQNRLIGG